jgi:hypothetical protein
LWSISLIIDVAQAIPIDLFSQVTANQQIE